MFPLEGVLGDVVARRRPRGGDHGGRAVVGRRPSTADGRSRCRRGGGCLPQAPATRRAHQAARAALAAPAAVPVPQATRSAATATRPPEASSQAARELGAVSGHPWRRAEEAAVRVPLGHRAVGQRQRL